MVDITKHKDLDTAHLHIPKAHKASHQDAGDDELNVAGLSGELTDDQPGKVHALGSAKHTAATLAELNAKVSDATLDKNTDTRTPTAHKTSHQNGGDDEMSIAGLSGEAADDQPPKTHAISHKTEQSDPIKLDELASPDDNVKLNASTSAHGLSPKLNNVVTDYYNGQGGWSEPPGGAGGRAKEFCMTIPGDMFVTDKITGFMTREIGNITGCYAKVDDAPTGADLKIDVKIDGNSLWTDADRLIIADGNTSGQNVALDDTDFSAGSLITIDIDQIGSTNPGTFLYIVLTFE